VSVLPVSVTVTIEPLSCGACGVWFGLESSMYRSRRQDGQRFYCPRGCAISWSDFENARLKRELEEQKRFAKWADERAESARRERDHQKARAAVYRGHLTRVRRRIGNGVCPCCKRTFKQLAAHMERQHPEYGQPVEAAGAK